MVVYLMILIFVLYTTHLNYFSSLLSPPSRQTLMFFLNCVNYDTLKSEGQFKCVRRCALKICGSCYLNWTYLFLTLYNIPGQALPIFEEVILFNLNF